MLSDISGQLNDSVMPLFFYYQKDKEDYPLISAIMSYIEQ